MESAVTADLRGNKTQIKRAKNKPLRGGGALKRGLLPAEGWVNSFKNSFAASLIS